MFQFLSMHSIEVLKIVNNPAAVTVMDRRQDETETHLQCCLYTAILTTIYSYLMADACLLVRLLGLWCLANELTVYLFIFTKNVGY